MKKIILKIRNIKVKKETMLLGIALVGSSFILPELAHAGTGAAEWDPALTKVEEVIDGTGGKIIAAVSLGFALVASIFKFNPAAIASAVGVGLVAGVGPDAVTAAISAVV